MNFLKFLERNYNVVWLVTASYMLIIFILSSMPYPPQPLPSKGGITFIEHVIEFGILGFLLLISFRVKTTVRKAAILAILISILYGISDEIHQAFVPGRYSDIVDVLADSVGAIIAIVTTNFKMRD